LKAVYEHLGSLLGHRNERQQITTRFAGGALALIAVGAIMSMRWFGRLI
jgi:Ca-activated chloride channel family protein